MSPRGIRNNNPGNIRIGSPWQGLATSAEMTDDQFREKDFCVFKSPKWGVRAIARTLITYYDKREALDGSKIDTVQEIIDRWAPPNENDTDAYAKHIRQSLSLALGDKINLHLYSNMFTLIKFIILHENGIQPYTDAQIDAGLILAGVTPPEKPLTATRTVKGGTVASLGTVGATGVEAIVPLLDSAKGQVASLIPYLEWAKWAFAAMVIIGIGVMLWARIDDRRKGLR